MNDGTPLWEAIHLASVPDHLPLRHLTGAGDRVRDMAYHTVGQREKYRNARDGGGMCLTWETHRLADPDVVHVLADRLEEEGYFPTVTYTGHGARWVRLTVHIAAGTGD